MMERWTQLVSTLFIKRLLTLISGDGAKSGRGAVLIQLMRSTTKHRNAIIFFICDLNDGKDTIKGGGVAR